jgi:hypothetical protein
VHHEHNLSPLLVFFTNKAPAYNSSTFRLPGYNEHNPADQFKNTLGNSLYDDAGALRFYEYAPARSKILRAFPHRTVTKNSPPTPIPTHATR